MTSLEQWEQKYRDSATRFRALLRRHSTAVPQTLHLGTPAFYGWSGRSRIDFVATPPSVQFSRIFVNFTAGRRLQLIPAGPRDHMPLTMDLVTNPTRVRWDHEKIEEMLSDRQGSLFSGRLLWTSDRLLKRSESSGESKDTEITPVEKQMRRFSRWLLR